VSEIAVPDHAPVPVDDRRITATGDVTLAVRVRNPDGAGTPVLLVHGLSSNARLWDGVAGELAAAGHPVAAVDQRGHGRSDKPDDGYDFATLTADLVAVADALGWSDRPMVAAGQSWGGNVVLELAARHPDRLVAAVLVDGGTIEFRHSFADWPTAEAALAPPEFAGTTAEAFARMLRSHHADWPEAGIEGTLGNVEVLPDGTIRPWLSRPHHLAILRGMWDHHPSERYGEVTVPTLIVPAGDPDASAGRFEVAKREGVHRAEQGLPRSATRWIPGDHDLHAQHPVEVAALIAGAADGTVFAGA
jgi:pimeloyl-ACP methyl ester carboxylesterase